MKNITMITIPLEEYTKIVAEATALKKEVDEKKKFEMVLSIRYRIKFLEEFFDVPSFDTRSGKHIIHREERWLTWFDTKRNNLFVKELETKIKAAGLNTKLFCKSLHVLYGDFSDRVAHRIPLPNKITEADIDGLVELIGVFGNKPVKAVVKILVTPIEGKIESDTSASDNVEFQ